jgi:hypothetical protein
MGIRHRYCNRGVVEAHAGVEEGALLALPPPPQFGGSDTNGETLSLRRGGIHKRGGLVDDKLSIDAELREACRELGVPGEGTIHDRASAHQTLRSQSRNDQQAQFAPSAPSTPFGPSTAKSCCLAPVAPTWPRTDGS